MAEDRIQISQLPSTLSLNESDEIAINNAGDTRKASLSQVKDTIGVTDHLADDVAHRPLDDTITTPTSIWSSQKTRDEIDSALENRSVNADQFSGVLPVDKGGTGLGTLDGGKLLYTQGPTAMTEVAMGPTLEEENGAINVVDDTSIQQVEVMDDGNLAGVRKSLNFKNSGDIKFTVTDDEINNKVDIETTLLAVGPLQIADNGVNLAGTTGNLNIQEGDNVRTDVIFTAGAEAYQNNVDLTIHADTSVQDGGTAIAKRPNINFVDGQNTTATATDDAANNRVDIHVDAVTDIQANDVSVAAQESVNFKDGTNTTVSVTDDTANNRVNVSVDAKTAIQDNAVDVGARPKVNFKDGVNTTVVTADDGVNDRLDVQVDAKVSVQDGGVATGAQPNINFVDGDNITVTATDDPANNRVDIEIDAKTQVQANDVLVGTQPKINFKAGANTTVNVIEDAANNRINVAIDTPSDGTVNVKNNGALVGNRGTLNLIPGTNVTLDMSDDSINGEVDITINASGGSGDGTVDIYKGGVLTGSRGGVNFIEGDNVTITQTDDAANDKIDVTINANGSGGIIHRDFTDTTTAASTASQDLFAYTIPGGQLGANDVMRIVISGEGQNNTGSIQAIDWRLKLGTNTIQLPAANYATDTDLFHWKFIFEIVANGTTAQEITAWFQATIDEPDGDNDTWMETVSYTLDMSLDQLFELEVSLWTANASLWVKKKTAYVEQIAANGLGAGGGAGGITGVDIRDNGSPIGNRPALNFHAGSNVTLTIADDAVNNEVDVTITASTGGSGGHLLNVQDYGAVGDGVTSDSAAIQAAINDCITQGKSGVFFPDGTYLITSAITTPGGSEEARQRPSIVNMNPYTDRITFDKDPGLQNGDPAAFWGDTLPHQIEEFKVYNVRRITATEYELYDTRNNAINTASTVGKLDMHSRQINSIDLTTNIITFSTPHSMQLGQRVRFSSTGTLPGGISSAMEYVFRPITDTTGTLHPVNTNTTSADYPASYAYDDVNRIDITSAGSGTHDMVRVGGQLHPMTTRYHNGLILKGSGRAVLKKNPSAGLTLLLWSERFDNLVVEDLEFWGRNYEDRWIDDYGGSYPYWGDDGFRVSSCHNVQFHRCRFKYFGDGAIRFATAYDDKNVGPMSENLTVKDCHFYMCTQVTTTVSNTKHPSAATVIKYINNIFEKLRGGVKLSSKKSLGASDAYFIGNIWKDSPITHQFNAPLEIQAFSRVYVKDNVFKDMQTPGGPEGTTILVIPNNSSTASGGSMDVFILENNVLENCARGVDINNRNYADGSRWTIHDVIIRGNVFRNLYGTAETEGAISLSQNAVRRMQIVGNHFEGISTKYGIYAQIRDESDGALDNNFIIQANMFYDMRHSDPVLIGLLLDPDGGSVGTKRLRNILIGDMHVTEPVVMLRANDTSNITFRNVVYDNVNGNFLDSTLLSNLNHVHFYGCWIRARNGIIAGSIPNLHIHGCYFECEKTAISNSSAQNDTFVEQGNTIKKGTVSIGNPTRGFAFGGRRQYFCTGTPAQGDPNVRTHYRGDWCIEKSPVASGTYAWINTSDGTFASFGGTAPTATSTVTSNVIPVSSTSELQVGDFIQFNGGTKVQIQSIDSATQITVSQSISVMSGQAIAFVAPIYKAAITLAA